MADVPTYDDMLADIQALREELEAEIRELNNQINDLRDDLERKIAYIEAGSEG